MPLLSRNDVVKCSRMGRTGNANTLPIKHVHQTLLEDYGVAVMPCGRNRARLVHAATGRQVSKAQFLRIARELKGRGLQLIQLASKEGSNG